MSNNKQELEHVAEEPVETVLSSKVFAVSGDDVKLQKAAMSDFSVNDGRRFTEQQYNERKILIEQDEDNLSSSEPAHKYGKYSVVGASLFFLLFSIGIYELIDFVNNSFELSPFSTLLYASFFTVLFAIIGRLTWRELRALFNLKQQHKFTHLFSASYIENLDLNKAQEACKTHYSSLGDVTLSVSGEKFLSQLSLCQNAHDVAVLYQQTVIAELDKKALKYVAKASTDIALVSALSPLALLDSCFVFYRQLKLINKLASLYGLDFGYLARIRLLRQLVIFSAAAGASELLTDMSLDFLGAEVAGKLSAKIAQGFSLGIISAQLGLKAMETCRPLPFIPEKKPKIAQIRGIIVERLLASLKLKK